MIPTCIYIITLIGYINSHLLQNVSRVKSLEFPLECKKGAFTPLLGITPLLVHVLQRGNYYDM